MIFSVAATVTPNGTTQIGSRLRGRILAVKVTSDSVATTGFDITLTGNTTGIPILTDTSVANNSTVWWHPRALASVHTSGADSAITEVMIPVFKESIQCVIANTAAGTITVTVIYDSDE